VDNRGDKIAQDRREACGEDHDEEVSRSNDHFASL